jgi:RNA polymerase sigma factor (sigma-70 family)
MTNATESLASAAAERNRRISQIVQEYRKPLRLFLRRRIFNADAVEEILQDVFVELVESFRLGQEVEAIGGWLITVARNRLIDRFRRNAVRDAHVADLEASNSASAEWADVVQSTASGPEAQLLQELLLDELAAAIAELPPEQAAVFLAHEIEGLSFKALADELGVGVSTLLARKHRAVKFLRRRLDHLRLEFAAPSAQQSNNLSGDTE